LGRNPCPKRHPIGYFAVGHDRGSLDSLHTLGGSATPMTPINKKHTGSEAYGANRRHSAMRFGVAKPGLP